MSKEVSAGKARPLEAAQVSRSVSDTLLRNRLNQALPMRFNRGLLVDCFNRLQGFAVQG